MTSVSLQFYHGSSLLKFLCPLTGLTLDVVNFVTCCLASVALGQFMRRKCDPRFVSVSTRLTVEMVLGIVLLYYCFGKQILIFGAEAVLAYAMMAILPRHVVGGLTTVVCMMVLAVTHLYRMHYDYGGYTLDITGPLMILTQKMSCLAFNMADGEKLNRHEKLVNERHLKHAVRQLPKPLEFFAFVFYFHGVLAGPMVFYVDYLHYIDGYGMKRLPDSTVQLKKVLCATLFHGVLTAVVAPQFPLALVVSHSMESLPLPRRLLTTYISFFLVRQKYYFAWSLCEAGGLSAGLGYTGPTDTDAESTATSRLTPQQQYQKQRRSNECWQGIHNFDFWKIEAGQSLKDMADTWNITTTWWLREAIYERSPIFCRTLLVFICSAVWHGFYPGYYAMFLTFALFTFAARTVRRVVRPLVLATGSGTNLFAYHVFTTVAASVAMNYAQAPFYFLMLEPSLLFWKHYYFLPHAVALGILLCGHVKPRLGDYCERWKTLKMRWQQQHNALTNLWFSAA